MDPRRDISSEARIKHMKRVVETSQQMVVLLAGFGWIISQVCRLRESGLF